jgi:S-adenosylmethionine:tRNA ribosyltransferase-isomerase
MAIGQQASFPGGLELTVLHRQGYGKIQAQLTWSGRLDDIFQAYGHMPLPPYIRREDEPKDRDRYQTVYAAQDQPGSVAAPTAGLHFSTEILSALKEKGVDWVELTLHVGYGTFSPVRCQDIRQHEMHPEYVELGAEAAACITRAQIEGRPIVALGTTSVRALEGIALECGQIQPFAGWIDIFIYPGFPFRVVDHLLTNFHLPGSSLILMASALAGRKTLLAVYKQAVAQGYRFFSYGDAMLIL